MKLITIQNSAILNDLKRTGKYIADFSRVSENLVKPYHRMSDYYGWNTCPVFCAPVNECVCFYGCKPDDGVAIQLEVPEGIVRLQYYYDWTDLIYFTEFPNEFADTFNLAIVPNIDAFAKQVLDFSYQGGYNIVQATLPYIESEWIEKISYQPNNIYTVYNYNSLLEELHMYTPCEAFDRKTSRTQNR